MKRARSAPEPTPSAPSADSNWALLSKRLRAERVRAVGHAAPLLSPPPPASALRTASPAAAPPDAAVAGAIAAARATVTGPFPAADMLVTGEHTRFVALDCEMVGVGVDGLRSALARVVVVDWYGRVLLDRHVRPSEIVTDLRTHVSGVTAAHVSRGEPIAVVQRDVAALLHNRVLVGHGLRNDLKALLLSHSWKEIRDTAKYQPFCWRAPGGGKWNPSKLKHLALRHLQLEIQVQGAAHEPAEDARAALALYKLVRRDWEHSLIAKKEGKKPSGK